MKTRVDSEGFAGVSARVVAGVSRPGGGSSPLGELPTKLLRVAIDGSDGARLERALRCGAPPVVARVHEGAVVLDLRTVPPEDDEALTGALIEALRSI